MRSIPVCIGSGLTIPGKKVSVDLIKGPTIYYNHLNLPKEVSFGPNDNLHYTYYAAGNKLVKVVDDINAENSAAARLHRVVKSNNLLILATVEYAMTYEPQLQVSKPGWRIFCKFCRCELVERFYQKGI